jgi:antitoxin HicB
MASKKTSKDLAHYMGLPYTFSLIPDPDEGGFAIKVNELPGCLSQGDTAEEALVRIREAMAGWLEVALEQGLPIPEPSAGTDDAYSGRFNVRVPKGLHRALAESAAKEGVSLNLYIATALASAVGHPKKAG